MLSHFVIADELSFENAINAASALFGAQLVRVN
jgi:hypothetical protein